MKIHLSKSASSLFVLFLTACTSSTTRLPAQAENQTQYKYSKPSSCVGTEVQLGGNWQPTGSVLAGMKVGRKPLSNWQKSNKRVLRPFTSDGCSMSPDGTPGSEADRKWVRCCVEHDIAYWMGGTLADKETADNELQQCIANVGYPEIGKVYKLFVKQFGGPNSPQTFRWGYGWNYQRPYSPLSAQEESMIREEYGQTIAGIKQGLKDSVANLVQPCDTYDYGLQKIDSEQDAIYRALSERAKTDDVIEWSKRSYFDLEKREYLVKLQSCEKPVKFVFLKNGRKGPQVVSDCQNL